MRYFDEALRLDRLPEPHRAVVEREGRALLGQCPSDIDRPDAPEGTQPPLAQPIERPDRHAIEAAFDWITRERHLGELTLAALVTSPNALPGTLHARGEALRALCVTVGIGLHEYDSSPPGLKPCCTCVRLALQGTRDWLVEELPNLDLPLDQIVAELLRLERRYLHNPVLRANRSREHRDARVADLRVALSQFLERRPAIRRDRETEPDVLRETVERTPAPLRVDGCSIDVIHDTTRMEPRWTEEDRNDKNPPSQELIVARVGSSAPRSLRVAFVEARDIAGSLAMQGAMTPCESRQLTAAEGASLFELAWKLAHGRSAEAAGAGWICLSLLTGRDTQELATLPLAKSIPRDSGGTCWIPEGGSGLMLMGHLGLPAHADVRKTLGLAPQGKNFLLPIPKELALVCRALLTDEERRRRVDEQTRSFARIAREHTNTSRISMNRVAGHMTARLVATGCDPLIPAMIRGATAKHYPSMYYNSTTCAALLEPWLNYCNPLLAAVHAEPLIVPPSTAAQRIGSSIEIDPDLLRAVLAKLHREILASWSNLGCSPIQQHNDMALWTYLVLDIACGFRAVRSALDRRSHYRSRTRQLWICDKANRSADTSRVVTVAETAGMQLDAYLAHLRSLAHDCAIFPRAVRDFATAVMADDQSMLFFIAGDDLDAAPIVATPKELDCRLETILPVPINFARHFLRQQLPARGHPWQLIDAHLGHDPLGREAYGRYSHTSWAQMQLTAQAVESILRELDVRVLRSRYGR